MGTERNWSSDAYKKARAESQQIETLMRSILKLFAEGNLVYRNRTRRSAPVQTKSDRLKRIRRGLVAMPFEQGSSGPLWLRSVALSLKTVRELLERDARGELTDREQAELQQNARTLRRRLDRVRALYPELDIELSEQLDELAQPPVLTASG